ncbi:Ig-like domain repeat protein [Streptomyces sp. NBC_00102]|uniref:Ig-like domain repeat protein n=1 Tax=Streptomyces sp. NBC_00102 TaxID=2975652 RepID=UPI00225532A2|nr:Ig-like domain repeat protein [Streptomyces sp. NBC_00102]MCX5396799.1 Ig-like domain repeat protein [Streptomyces sp. NBC_00102]
MRTRSISTATTLAVLFSSAALTVVSAGAASAASAYVTNPVGLVADGPLQRVYAGDSSSGKIVATDYAGTLVDSVGGLSGIGDLAVSDDGLTLWAALPSTHEIVALDAATLDVLARHPVATSSGPRSVAFTGGKLWFTYGDQWDGDLGSVDPAVDPATGTAVTLGLFPKSAATIGIWGGGLLDADPGTPGVLAIGETGSTPSSMAVVDVSGATPLLTAWHAGGGSMVPDLREIDLVPGGQVLVNGTDRIAYGGGAFSPAGSYPGGQRADIAPNGLVAQLVGTNIAVYRPNAVTPLRTYPTGVLGGANLTWAPDSSRAFALLKTSNGYLLRALTDPTKNVPTLTVNAPSTATRAKKLTVTGRLSASVALPAGSKLKVTRSDAGLTGRILPTVTVKADGTYSFTDTPTLGGTVTYAVSYAGDAGHASVSASDNVTVSRSAAPLTLNKNGGVYDLGADVTFTAHLGSTYKNRTVEIWVNPFGTDKPNKLVKTAVVNSAGNISTTVDLTRDTTVTAVFKGDGVYAPKSVQSTVWTRARVSTAVSGYFRTGNIGSTPYYWFHKNTDPVITTVMSAYPGRSERLDLEVYYGGRWYAADAEFFELDSAGRADVWIPAPGEVGIRARIRATYVDGASGDNVNSTTYGAWKYLYFAN